MTAPRRRVDVHQHAITPRIARLLERAGAPFSFPWSLEQTRDLLGAHRIDRAVVSNPVPPAFLGPATEALAFTTEVNESVAELRDEHPATFGMLAAVPMPHPDAALAATAHACDELHADGLVLAPHVDGDYLGHPRHAPLLAELDRREAVVLVHPTLLPGTGPHPDGGPPGVLADFLLDTTRAALSLILSGALDRHPRIRWLLAHAGGFLPYAASRVGALGGQFHGLDAATLDDALARFHYDTALAAPSAMPSLLATVPSERIVFGTDWCAAPAEVVGRTTAALDASLATAGVDDEVVDLIAHGNADRLFAGTVAPAR